MSGRAPARHGRAEGMPHAVELSREYRCHERQSVSEYEFTLSLRIRHPSVEPAEITRNLGIEPQHTWRAGDPRRDVAGSEINGTYRESYWMGRLMAKPELAADQVGVESEVLRTPGFAAQILRVFRDTSKRKAASPSCTSASSRARSSASNSCRNLCRCWVGSDSPWPSKSSRIRSS